MADFGNRGYGSGGCCKHHLPQGSGQGSEDCGLCRRVCYSVQGCGARLCRLFHRAERDSSAHHPVPEHAGYEARSRPGEEARQHSALIGELFPPSDAKWKDEGTHINEFTTLASGEKIIKVMAISELRNDLYLVILTKFGQIKRMALSNIDVIKHSRPVKYMKLLPNDSIAGVQLVTGDSDLLVITNNGNCSFFNENELSILGNKAGGVKSISGLGNNQIVGLLAFEKEEKSKIILFTNKGHMRVTDISKFFKTNRLGKVQSIMQSFKGDPHSIVSVFKARRDESLNINLYLNDRTNKIITVDDLRNTEAQYAKKNIDEITAKQHIAFVFDSEVVVVNKDIVSHPVPVKEVKEEENTEAEVIETAEVEDTKQDKEEVNFEQISIFDDLD